MEADMQMKFVFLIKDSDVNLVFTDLFLDLFLEV